MPRTAPPAPFPYEWVIVATGTLTVFAALGLGRFALGMLLPSMGAGLHLSYAQLGYVGTANFVGYLAAVLACSRIAARLGARLLVGGALLGAGATMLLVSRADGFAPLVLLYAATGFGSGSANIPVMALVARWFEPGRRGRAAGFVAIGSGFGIVASGQLVPWVNGLRGAEGWRTSWLVLGALVALAGVVALLLLRNAPRGAAGPVPAAGRPAAVRARFVPTRPVLVLSAIYAMFGYSYAIYVTFIVTSLVRERGFSEDVAGRFWSAIGLLSLLSGPVFGALSDRIGRRRGLMVVFALQLVAYALAAGRLPRPLLYASIGCFGVAAWSIPTIMMAAASDYAGVDRAVPALAFVTLFFGVGQIAGPALAGVLAQRTGSFGSSFLMAAGAAAVAIVLATFLEPPGARTAPARDRAAPA